RPAWETAGRKPIELPKPPTDTLPSELRKAVAEAGSGGTQIPYRCLYSRNVDNLLMAGRDVSATHVALMGIKVMGVTGHMGVATGAAALLCRKHSTTPRGVYQKHLAELQDIVFEHGAHANDLRAHGEQRGKNDTTQKPIESKGAKQ
ncbi:MAG: FAD-dependent oxidoreductase, partial [Planctomycetes bacterium]|nr:FAD-dependent oxidoreductase [Planctomycetota bacterium]